MSLPCISDLRHLLMRRTVRPVRSGQGRAQRADYQDLTGGDDPHAITPQSRRLEHMAVPTKGADMSDHSASAGHSSGFVDSRLRANIAWDSSLPSNRRVYLILTFQPAFVRTNSQRVDD
jgi:hypothetical protein